MISFESLISGFSGKRVLVVGDVMLDRFIYGDVGRISPEAPAPVLRAGRPEEIVGGAGNVARNIASLGAVCELAAVIGRDEAGFAILSLLKKQGGIEANFVESETRMTTVKTRFVANLHNTHLLRADWEDASPINAEIEAELLRRVEERLPSVDGVILSDYSKGTLTHRVTSKIIAEARAAGKPVIVDPKGSDWGRYRRATTLTPNLAELGAALGRVVANDDAEIETAARELMAETSCEVLLVTRSERGVMVVERDAPAVGFPATAARVVDVSGAGDTLVASFALALIGGAGAHNAARLANAAAGLVVAKKGTARVSSDELRDVFLSRPHFEIRSKVLDNRERLDARIAKWREDGLVIGFTNGCFDLLHPGHIALLAEARGQCDRLIVALNSDASVRRLKGKSRPIQNETARATVMAALGFVDAVVIFDEDTPLEMIQATRPDVLIKGADYRLDQVVGRDVVESRGGRVALIQLVPESSTTRIVSRIATADANAPAAAG
jgi:D-beta-D-heptose 7-phosphate kinase/D-beta-D-heptose 1-phosphate adenosyltransferase